MFTKVSERLCLTFFVKMGKTTAQRIRANELRRIEKSKRRQAYFISDYMQTKYFHLYNEAANFYNALNTLYPTKYDLRKTAEFRSWRMAFITGQRKTKRQPQPYQSIDTRMDTYLQNGAQCQTEPQSPENGEQLSESETEPQSPENGEQLSESETEPQSPENGEQLCQSEKDQSPENGESGTEPQSPEKGEQLSEKEPVAWNDNMQLRIPLLDYQPSAPTVTTQTVQIVTEETLDQSGVENDLLNELTNARIDQIIQELRQDPELHNIFDLFELDEGIDIDNDAYDIRLENELLTW